MHMDAVYVLQHLHILPDGAEDSKLIGVYRSLDGARAAATRLQVQPGFRDHPGIVNRETDDVQGFHIDRYQLDNDHWAEGFDTI